MKRFRFLTLAMLLLVTTALFSQTPSTISLQGVLREATGAATTDGQLAMTFKIYDVLIGGTALWSETQTITVTNGVYSAQLGASTALNINFSQQYYVGVTVGGTELAPRMVLTAAPYAMGLRGSSNVFGGGGNVGIGTLTPDASKKLHVVGDELVSGNVAAGSITTTGSVATGAITATGNISATGTITANGTRFAAAGSTNGIRIYAASFTTYYTNGLGFQNAKYSDPDITFEYSSSAYAGGMYLTLPASVDLTTSFISATVTAFNNSDYKNVSYTCFVDPTNSHRLLIVGVSSNTGATIAANGYPGFSVMLITKTN